MRYTDNRMKAVLLPLACGTVLWAQQNQTASQITTVPRLVRVANSFHPAIGPAAQVESVTLSIYREEQGGSPLWQETQNVNVDAEGRYVVLLGTTRNDGLPIDLFRSGEPRWLGVQFNRAGETEQSRVLLVSVPYALKAAEAETLGGKPASAYLLAPPAETDAADTATSPTNPQSFKLKPRATTGVQNYLGVFTNTTDLGSSILYQAANKIVLGTTAPKDYLHVQFSDTTGSFTGYSVQNNSSFATAYSGMLFYDQNGALGQFQGFNNSTHEYRINNIATNGSINFMLGGNSRFQVSSSGIFMPAVRGATTGQNNAVAVVIDSNGQLGTISSSRRFKEDIHDMGDASRGLMRLRPVTFRYKKPFDDGSKPIQYGLIAEEVAEVYPDLVARSADGQIETVKYQVLDSMLLNEVQRQQAEIRELRERLAKLEAALSTNAGANQR